MTDSSVHSKLSIIFNQEFKPLKWDQTLDLEFNIKLDESKDLRKDFSFLYATENILSALISSSINSWELENIILNNKNYSVIVTKELDSTHLKLELSDNHLSLLEEKVFKQTKILNDPFHWSRSDSQKGINDLNFLITLTNGLKNPINNLNSTYLELAKQDSFKKNYELEQIRQQLLLVKDLFKMTDNYLKLRQQSTQKIPNEK